MPLRSFKISSILLLIYIIGGKAILALKNETIIDNSSSRSQAETSNNFPKDLSVLKADRNLSDIIPRKLTGNNDTYKSEEGGIRKKKKLDKFDKLVDKLHSARLIKFDGSILVPTLMGILLKVATAIPIILAISTVVGTISLLGSKLALLISAVLGVRTLIQYFNVLNPPPREAPPITQSDMTDIQNMIAKQNQMSEVPILASSPPPTSSPIKAIPVSIPVQAAMPPPAIMIMNPMKSSLPQMMTPKPTDPPQIVKTTEAPADPYPDLDNKYVLFGHPGFVDHPGFIGHHPGHYGITNPDIHVDYGVKENLYYPENYFVHNPSAAEVDTHNLIHHNQVALDDLHHQYGPPYFVHGLKRIDANIDTNKKSITKLKNIHKFSDKAVIKSIKDMLQKNGQSNNIISKVKIVKSVKS